jgi:multidrug resistance efflux pump
MLEELNEKAVEIRSEEMDDILSKTPTWLIRRGVIVIFFVVIFLLAGSWLFHYPDSVSAPIIITSANPPSSVVARSDGKIVSFFVKDQQEVIKGDYLIILENTADENSINKLLTLFHTVDTLPFPICLVEINVDQLLNLGDLQQAYTNFVQAIRAYKRYLSLPFNEKKIAALEQQINLTNNYVNKLCDQKNLQTKNLELSQNQFNRDSMLFSQKVITPAEFEKSQIQLINSISVYKSSEMAMTNSQIQINQLRQQIIELEFTQEKEIEQLIDDVNNAYHALKSQFDAWELIYVLKSPVSGKAVIGNYWSENQNVKAGDVIMSVIPTKKEAPFGKITLAMENSGKIRLGQKVNIKLSNFPATEFGMLKGYVHSVSLVPEQGNYYVKVELTNGLTTNYNIQLPFMQEMTGNAEIITEDMRLIERIIDPIRLMFKEKVAPETPKYSNYI